MSHLPSLYTCESVTAGHPDKVCDQISDAILDAHLAQDPSARVAVETFGSHGTLVIGGEITSTAQVNHRAIAERVYRDIGHTDPLNILEYVVQQSPEIAAGVDDGGAGDQGIMYGYACNQTPELLPIATAVAHALTRRLDQVRGDKTLAWLRPDGKSQVTVRDGLIETILLSVQHNEDVAQEQIRAELVTHVVIPVLSHYRLAPPTNLIINPSGSFVVGGFEADAGLTGRKIMVDTYGGVIPHGGGAFSGKDPSKVDRSGAYMARYVAKQLVASGAADECLVSVAYAIGMAEPLMVHAIDGDGRTLDHLLENFDFRPKAIIATLDLRTPIYQANCTSGHFTHASAPWERIDEPDTIDAYGVPSLRTTSAH